VWFAELAALCGVSAGPNEGKHAGEKDCFEHTMNVLDRVKSTEPGLRFAGLCHDFGKAFSEDNHHGHDELGIPAVESFCARLKVPTHYRTSATLFCREHMRMHRILEMRSGKAVALIMSAHKGMVKGLSGFLDCSIGDGMEIEEAKKISEKAQRVISAKLPVEYIGRGKACSDIMMQIRCKAWSYR
jgi:tRNA nucleotidyltransferase/poly(A) polymerase